MELRADHTRERDTINSGDALEERKEPNKCRRRNYWHPNTLDVKTWVGVSKVLREEKIRVLRNRKDIWRKFDSAKAFLCVNSKPSLAGLNMISVDPVYQRQGIGSMLLQWGCEDADAHGRDSFLIASPAGIRLYAKFGFKVVGEVRTSAGTFTSMFREAR